MSKKNYRIRMTRAQLLDYAARANYQHKSLIADGYELARSSGFWNTKRAGITARLVYRSTRGVEFFRTITVTIRGI